MMNCPLCESIENPSFVIRNKIYYSCTNCGLTYLDSENFLLPDDEKKRYSFHHNDIKNSDYVDFLNRVIEPSLKYLNTNMCGLDFGCGPNPVLAQLLEQKGYCCSYYDPFFYPEFDLSCKYDFIFATECFEHFFSPQKELSKISNILNKGGILSIMTELYDPKTNFENWYYKNDPTHVCFWSQKTLSFIMNFFKFEILYSDNKRVVILKKI